MQITSSTLKLLTRKRDSLAFSLTDISRSAGDDQNGKPILSVPTLSLIFSGKLTSIRDETFKVLAQVLGVEEGEVSDIAEEKLRVAYGLSGWASPLIATMVSDIPNRKLDFPSLEFYRSINATNGRLNKLEFFSQKVEETESILTAKEIQHLLRTKQIDVGFLPAMTTDGVAGIAKVSRSMNTTKGGVYLYIIEQTADKAQKHSLDDEEDGIGKVKEQLCQNSEINPTNSIFVFPDGSIAKILIEQILFSKTKYEQRGIEVGTLAQFSQTIRNEMDKFFKKGGRYFVFAGWDYLIDKLEMYVNGNQNYKGKIVDAYRLTDENLPYTPMSYDCVVLEENLDQLKRHPGFIDLLTLLSERVKDLNVKKTISNSLYRLIADFLQMDRAFCEDVLNRINWEFLIYPELYNKNLK